MIILYFITNSLSIFGIHAITEEGMIFGFVQRWVKNALGWPIYLDGLPEEPKLILKDKLRRQNKIDFIMKPLFTCPPCMASVYGVIGYCLVVNDTQMGWGFLPLWVICLAGLNYILNKI